MECHVYQSATGGKTYCPLEVTGRIIMTATPRFAKILSYKYADLGLSRLCQDLEISNGRKVLRSYAHKIGDLVGSVAELKVEVWTYQTPVLHAEIATVTVGLDETCMLMHEDGWREAMVGTVALYDKEGERQHTIYIGASPEYGKKTFLSRLESEIGHAKKVYGKALYIGLADGAKSNWGFLEKHTERKDNVKDNLPIGSGVTEAACKVIVKQRLCNSGMRWKDKGARVVLSLRCLTHTPGRWNQFWDKIDLYGFQMAE